MQYKYKILTEKNIHQSFFKVRQFELVIEYFEGGFSPPLVRECLGSGGFVVAALPFDPVTKKIFLVEQFRIGALTAGFSPWHLEVVAGFMDKNNEDKETAIQRELLEEIGTSAQQLFYQQSFLVSPGGSSGQTHLFFAQVDSNKIKQFTGLKNEGEDIKVHSLDYQTVFDWLKNKQLKNSLLILAVQSFYLQQLANQ